MHLLSRSSEFYYGFEVFDTDKEDSLSSGVSASASSLLLLFIGQYEIVCLHLLFFFNLLRLATAAFWLRQGNHNFVTKAARTESLRMIT